MLLFILPDKVRKNHLPGEGKPSTLKQDTEVQLPS